MHTAMKPPQSARSSPPHNLSPIDAHALAIDVDAALAPHQDALPAEAVAARTERLRGQLELLMPHVESTPPDARGLIVNRALRDARELVARGVTADDRFAAWVHMRALARVTALLCGHSRKRSTHTEELTLPAPSRAEGAISRWLASSIDTPDIAFEDWQSGRPAVLRTGRAFDAVRMPQTLVHAAARSTVPDVVSGGLCPAAAVAELLRAGHARCEGPEE